MQHSLISYDHVSQLSQRDKAYIDKDEKLTPFITAWPTLAAFGDIITSKSKQEIKRDLIHKTVSAQYAGIKTHTATQKNIDLLSKDNTYCVITAHQPSLLTGPLYYIYKICSTINLARQLDQHYPDVNVIPVFISGAEDHDFEEVNHLNLFGKKIIWETSQTGPVGRFTLDGLQEVISTITELLGTSPAADRLKASFDKAYEGSKTYNEFVHKLVNDLFGSFGLVSINMDNRAFKAEAKDIFKKEMTSQASHKIVSQTISQLQALGFKAQAEPREINLFYIDQGIRERFVFVDGKYQVNNTEMSFTESEILQFIDDHPDKISPNVVIRPLYQEWILPNLAYIGGGGELSYWQERKAQFAAFGIPMPLLLRRNSAIYIDKSSQKQQNKLGLSLDQIFKPEHLIAKQFLSLNSDNELDLNNEKAKLGELFEQIAQKAKAIAQPLEKYVLAEQTKQLKALDNIEAKLVKAEKQNHDVSLGRITKIKEKLFPSNGLQERKENFMGMYLQNGEETIPYLIDNLDPLRNEFVVFTSS